MFFIVEDILIVEKLTDTLRVNEDSFTNDWDKWTKYKMKTELPNFTGFQLICFYSTISISFTLGPTFVVEAIMSEC